MEGAVINNNRKGLPLDQIPVQRILRWGRDHPTFGGPVPKIDLNNWILEVKGVVERSLKLDWNGLLELPTYESVIDFHCVEGWSILNLRWEGIRFEYLVDLVKPKDIALFVSFNGADGYTTSLSISELIEEDALLAYMVNGQYLEAGLGVPLRLVIPDRYAY